jgi:hypothetical protein
LDAGCAHILWNELYRWYDVRKIAAGTYRDITERWQEISGGKGGDLRRVRGEDGIHLFAEESIESLSGD